MLLGFRVVVDAALLHRAVLSEQALEERPVHVIVQVGDCDLHLGWLANVVLIDLGGRKLEIGEKR